MSIKDFSNSSALDALKQGGLLLDIRTIKEYDQGHLKNAILVPTRVPPFSQREIENLKDQLKWILSKNSFDTPIVLYCHKGKRSMIARELIKELGYMNVIVWGGVEVPPLNKLFQ
jgi:phage shock protein E